ncbi:hypothetical protein Arno18_28 [Pectobacterium phage Arno18]|uniref:Uncharacterized protein n=1 Tax=Pectobacterium phage Arno18 TaxID=2500578 RepID=A0A678ZK16_9CAUD|nr:hypothetical protein Arno18_28 [Pectobacterium phage Arno18]
MLIYTIQYRYNDSLDLKAVAVTEETAQARFKELTQAYGLSLKAATRYISIEIWDAETGDYVCDLKPITE